MIHGSADFEAQVTADQQHPICRVEAVHPDGQVIARLLATEATLTESRNGGAITRTLSLTVADELELTEVTNGRIWGYGEDRDTYGGLGGYYGTYPLTDVLGLLQPYGIEVRVSVGYRIPVLTNRRLTYREEYLVKATLPVIAPSYASMTAEGVSVVTVVLGERSSLIARNTYTHPLTLGPASYTSHAKSIFANRLPPYWATRLSLTGGGDSNAAPLTHYGSQVGGDPWNEVIQLMRLTGQVVQVNRLGQGVISPAPELRLKGAPDYTLKTGEKGLLLGAKRSFFRDRSHNRIVVIGAAAGDAEPAYGESSDTFPYSAMRTQGPVGIATKTVRLNNIDDQVVAQALADRLAVEYFSLYETLDVTMLPDPRLELTDTVRVIDPATRTDATYFITRLSLPVTNEGAMMTLTLQRQRNLDEDTALQTAVGTIDDEA